MTTEADYPPLRPCPFCGKVPIGIDEGEGREFEIVCDAPCGFWVVLVSSRAEAADKWNRRAKL